MSSYKTGTERGAIRFAFSIHNRAILLCWAYYDVSTSPPSEPGLTDLLARELSVEPTSRPDDWDYSYLDLRTDRGEKHHWRWALIVPTKQPLPDGPYTFRFEPETENAKNIFVKLHLLRFDEWELADMIDQSQALTLPTATDPDSVISLQLIESLIAETEEG